MQVCCLQSEDVSIKQRLVLCEEVHCGLSSAEKQLVSVDSTVDDVIQTQLSILISLSEAQ